MLWGFRVDTNIDSGLGHVSRMLSILEIFDNKKNILFIVNSLKDKNCSIIRDHKYKLVDINSLNDELDICIIDGYFFTRDEINLLIRKSQKIIQIDDHGYKYDYANKTINFLSNGAENAVVSDMFFSNNFFKVKKNVKNILISFGMIDRSNATILTIKALKLIEKNLNSKIFISLPKKKIDSFKILSAARQIKNVEEVKNYAPKDFCKLLKKIDMSISSGGVTLNESLSMGVPSVVLSSSDNQIKKINYFIKKKLIYYSGDSSTITKYKLASDIKKFYLSFSLRGKISRNSKIIFNKRNKKKFILRNIIKLYEK